MCLPPGVGQPGDRLGQHVVRLGVGDPYEAVEPALRGEGGTGRELYAVAGRVRHQGRGQRPRQLAPEVEPSGRPGDPPVRQVRGDCPQRAVARGAQLGPTVLEQVLAVAEQVDADELFEHRAPEVEAQPGPEERVELCGRQA